MQQRDSDRRSWPGRPGSGVMSAGTPPTTRSRAIAALPEPEPEVDGGQIGWGSSRGEMTGISARRGGGEGVGGFCADSWTVIGRDTLAQTIRYHRPRTPPLPIHCTWGIFRPK
jgi:hypothetical protein